MHASSKLSYMCPTLPPFPCQLQALLPHSHTPGAPPYTPCYRNHEAKVQPLSCRLREEAAVCFSRTQYLVLKSEEVFKPSIVVYSSNFST